MQDPIDGRTALHGVVISKRWDLVPVLVHNGADVNLCDKQNDTPLHAAVRDDAPTGCCHSADLYTEYQHAG